MEVNDQTLGVLRDLLTQILSPDNTTRKGAEAYIVTHQTQPGFPILILTMIERLVAATDAQDLAIRQSASVLFKNMIKNKWKPDEDEGAAAGIIGDSDKVVIKNHLVELMCVAPADVQKQLSEAVSLISKHDFPQQWMQLLPQLVSKLQTQELNIIQGVMLTANSIMKRFRYVYRSDELYTEILFCLDGFKAPLLEQFKACGAMVERNMQNKNELTVVIEALRLMCRIYFSLNWQDIPEFFEDTAPQWMEEFAKYLTFKCPLLVDDDEEAEPGAIEKLQAAILENLNLYATKYEDVFTPFVATFTRLVWELLLVVGTQSKYDLLATSAIKFLTSVGGKQVNQSLFNDAALKDIVQLIVVKNLTATEADEELFEDNPSDYIRKDMEGSDQDTRRRSATELVRSLLKLFGPQVSQLCTSYVADMLQQYNTSKNWRAKDAALHLVLAVAVQSSTVVTGAGELNPNFNVLGVFESHVLPEVHDVDVNARPIVKADAIKLICIFRSHLQSPFLLSILPHIIRHLSSKHVVIQTYAAMCIERFLSIKDRDPSSGVMKARIAKEDLTPFFQPLFQGLFTVLENKELPENDYVMKCIMRVLVVIGGDVGPVTELVLSHLTTSLERVCKNPMNPHYNHYLFESVAVLVRSCCIVSEGQNPMLTPQQALESATRFETLLFPPFQLVLSQDVVEFVPYVFQIFAQLLCSRPTAAGLSGAYQALFPPLLSPVLWERRGNVPALTDLFDAYISRGMSDIVSGGHVTGVLGVFQKLLASKATEEYSFRLLNTLFTYNSLATLTPYLQTIFNLLLHRMQESVKDSKVTRYSRLFLHSLSVFSAVHGPQPLCDILESITAGLVSMIVMNIWSVNQENCAGSDQLQLKQLVVGGTRLLLESATVMQKQDVWSSLLKTVFVMADKGNLTSSTSEKSATALVASFDFEGSTLESMEFDSSYSKLVYATLPTIDCCTDIPSGASYFASKLSAFLQSSDGARIYGPLIGQSLTPAEATALQSFLQRGSTTTL